MTTATGKTMTIREVSAALGVSTDTVLNSIKDLESQSENIRFGKIQGQHGGKPYYVLTEAQVTAVKMNLQRSLQVAAMPKTQLEKALIIQQALQLQQDMIADLNAEIAKVSQENQTLQIELSKAQEWFTVKRVLIETGNSYPWKPLKEYSLQNGYEIHKAFDQNYVEVNAYHIDVWYAVYGVEL